MTYYIDRMIERGIQNVGNLVRMKQLMKRANVGEEIGIGFIGGSITMGSLSSTTKTCYAYLVYTWWRNKFPQSKVHYINGGIGGTTSHFGVARVDSDLLYAKPDFVIAEFSVNDKGNDHFAETYEGLLRRILKSSWEPAVLVVNSVQYDNGENAQAYHNFIGKAYDLPIVSMKNSIYEEIKAGNMNRKDITRDNLHPNDAGHKLMADMIIGFLEKVYSSMELRESSSYLVPARPVTCNGYEDAIRWQNYNCSPMERGFIKDTAKQVDICDIFKHGWFGRNLGDKISFTVKGSNLAVQYRKSVKKPAPVAYAVVDGDERNKIKLDGNFEENWGDCLYLQDILRDGIEMEHNVDIVIEGTSPKSTVDFYLVSIIGSGNSSPIKR